MNNQETKEFIGCELTLIKYSYKLGSSDDFYIRTVKSKDYTPYNIMVKPAAGCEFIINDSSISTESIFELSGIDPTNLAFFSLKRYNKFSFHTYCKPINVEKAKKEILLKSKQAQQEYKEYLTNQLSLIENQ